MSPPSKPLALAKWQALAVVLKQAMPECDFEVESAVGKGSVFSLTLPSANPAGGNSMREVVHV